MGIVYRALDEATGRRVALKQMGGPPADPLRFRREFHTMRNLAHPRIVEVYDYGVDGTPYYTLELLDGLDLGDLETLPWRFACELLRDVASALAFLHARRLLHRDLAPRNVRCTSEGRAKLIDFGVLSTMGVTEDIAGTPPFMAPEIASGRALDHRYDLFGLGALAYRILTGHLPFPARTVEQLATLHRPPSPASAFVPDIPPQLDALVFALLSADPLARPASAAEVIDRLTVIGDLERVTEVETTHGWIASAALVGREREVALIRRSAARAHEGRGRSIMIEAPSGTGKSRLLGELAVESQLVGTTVVRANADASERGPYAIIHALARGMLASTAEAVELARPRGAVLSRVITELRERLDVVPARPEGEANEDRLRLQEELAGWFRDVAARRPLALLVDDIQRCDEASAAVLAALARTTSDQLLLGFALRTDENVRAPAAVSAIADGCQRLRLRGLSEAEVEALCRSLFGDVPHIPRLARWMHRTAGGSPLHTMELARHLVDREIIRYNDGLWSIPENPPDDDLPHGLAAAMDARVRSLPSAARALGEALSIHGGELTLALIVSIADSRDEEAVFAALDILAYEEVLLQAGTSWRFRHDGLREALLRGLDTERRRALHLRVGETLLAMEGGSRTSQRRARTATSAERDAEIGWHLLRGGDKARGAALLERAGRALYAAQSFLDCIAPLEAALEHEQTTRRSARVRLELQHMLLMAGCMADRKTAVKHADECVAGFRYWSGMDVAESARRFVGKHIAVLLGLWCALLRWIFTPRRGPNPYEAFRTYFLAVGYSASVYLATMDESNLSRMVKRVEPIAIFKRRVPYAVYLITKTTLEFPLGNLGAVRRNTRMILKILESDRLTPISDIDRRTAIGGARYLLILAMLSSHDPEWQDELVELAKVRLKFYDVGAEHARLIYHRMRGEEEIAMEIERRLEVVFVQLGSIWQMEAMVAMIASLAYAFVRDTLGLRRMIEELGRLCNDGFCLEAYLHLARGEYLRERGDVHEALEEIDHVAYKDHIRLLQVAALPALAETLLAAGEIERAKKVAEDGVRVGADPDYGNLHGELRSARVLALAEAALGDCKTARTRLTDAIARGLDRDSPLLLGSLHEARARVALLDDDAAGFAADLAETERHFRRTRNPALVARAERLSGIGRTHALRTARAATAEPVPTIAVPASTGVKTARVETYVVTGGAVTTPVQISVRSRLAACPGALERANTALALLLDATRAATGYLFVVRDPDRAVLELAAPTWGVQPPDALVDALTRMIVAPEERVTSPDRGRPSGDALAWHRMLLTVERDTHRRVVGAVAVRADQLSLKDPDPDLLDDIAEALLAAGDAALPAVPKSTAVLTSPSP